MIILSTIPTQNGDFCRIKPLDGSSKDPSLDLTSRHMEWVTKLMHDDLT